MTEQQKQKHIKKGWIIALAAVLILACALFTANAATDGAIFNGKLFQDLHIFLNDKEVTYELSEADRTTDKDGNPVDHYSLGLPDGKTIDAYVAEEYTAFALDADDVDSLRIVGNSDTDSTTP